MMSDIIIILFALHLLLAIVYAIDFRYERGNIQKTLLRFVICFMIPIFGFAFVWFSDYFEKRVQKISGRELTSFTEKTTELELLSPLDLLDEVNKVPMVEALQMGEYAFRRKAVIDTLKEDAIEYIDVLKEALLNDDVETSHYASSIIMDIQGKMQNSIFQKEVLFRNEPENIENTRAYEAELYKVIKSGVYEKRDLHKYYAKYKKVSDYLLKQEDITEICYHDRIDIDLETGDFLHARQLCEEYKQAFPASEEMVVDYIKSFVMLKDKEGLNCFLAQLKSMPVLLSPYSLQYIRFFEREKG